MIKVNLADQKTLESPSKALNRSYLELVEAMDAYCRSQDFSGWCKHDGLNSPILKSLSLGVPQLRLLFIQLMMRSPVNLRTVFLVEKSRNPKGLGLFARAYFRLFQTTGKQNYLDTALEVLLWLDKTHANQGGLYSGKCWGYNFPWQSPFFYAPKNFPNLCVTTFVAEAFLLAYEITGETKWLDTAESAANFLLNDLPVLEQSADRKCLGYIPGQVNTRVINVNAMVGAFLAKLYQVTNKARYRSEAKLLRNYVVQSSPEGRWPYTTGSVGAYVDNYHTGGIIEQLFDIAVALNDQGSLVDVNHFADSYRAELFTPEGAPKNRNNRQFPYDIHGSAQGIITFSKLGYTPGNLEFAERILDWTITNLYSGQGYFYYQKTRLQTKKVSFMRWCNAWMLTALAELLTASSKED